MKGLIFEMYLYFNIRNYVNNSIYRNDRVM